jgi:hypothetical protein
MKFLRPFRIVIINKIAISTKKDKSCSSVAAFVSFLSYKYSQIYFAGANFNSVIWFNGSFVCASR